MPLACDPGGCGEGLPSAPPTSPGPSHPLPLSPAPGTWLQPLCPTSGQVFNPDCVQNSGQTLLMVVAGDGLGTDPKDSSPAGRRCLDCGAVPAGRGRILQGPQRGSPGRPPACTLVLDAMNQELSSLDQPSAESPSPAAVVPPAPTPRHPVAPSRVRVSPLGLGPG